MNPLRLTDSQIQYRLRYHFRNARSKARFRSRQVFLELYSGKEVVTREIRKLGFGCIPFDIVI